MNSSLGGKNENVLWCSKNTFLYYIASVKPLKFHSNRCLTPQYNKAQHSRHMYASRTYVLGLLNALVYCIRKQGDGDGRARARSFFPLSFPPSDVFFFCFFFFPKKLISASIITYYFALYSCIACIMLFKTHDCLEPAFIS